MTMTTPLPEFDPASRSASSWGSRLAGLRSHGATDDDVRVVACQRGLAFWRIKGQVDHALAERLIDDKLASEFLAKLREHDDLLREPGGVVAS